MLGKITYSILVLARWLLYAVLLDTIDMGAGFVSRNTEGRPDSGAQNRIDIETDILSLHRHINYNYFGSSCS